jgi:hypothetical protein
MSQQNGERHAEATAYPCHRRQCWGGTPGGCGPLEQCEKSTRQTFKGRRRLCGPPALEKKQTKQLWRMDLPTGDEQRRKSTPRIGLDTAARMKETMKVWRPKLSFLVTLPQAEIGLPSAPAKRKPEVAAEDLCGNTETAAPVSTRNCLETESWRKMRPPRALSCPRRRPSFPPTHSLAGSSWRQPRTSGVELNNNTALTTQSERRFLDAKTDCRIFVKIVRK